MREALRKLGLNNRYRFEAVFSRFATTQEHIEGKEAILLLDVKRGNKLVANHLWLCRIQEFKKLNLKEGDIVSFTARINMYRRFKNQRKLIDFGLSNPMHVYKVNKEEITMTENTNLVTKVYVTNKFKLEVNLDLQEREFWLSQEELSLIFDTPSKTIYRILLEIEKSVKSTLQTPKMRIMKNGRKVNAYSSYFFKELNKRFANEISRDFENWVKLIFQTEELNSYEIVTFNQDNLSLDIRISPDHETVWMNQDEIAELFGTVRTNITTHINNIFEQSELEKVSVRQFFLQTGNDGKQYEVEYYNLDMILSIGYRVNSKRGIAFRKWANQILKDYLIKGYALNEKRLTSLGKTVEIQNKMLASSLGVDYQELSNVIGEYTRALNLLDDYDHQELVKPSGNKTTYQLTYEDARNIINKMEFNKTSDLFGREKEEGKLEGILAVVHQFVFGQEVYPSLEEKAAHLLYFLVKDHPFYDGCKRIAATLFLEFLNRNGALVKNGQLTISNDALVAITLLTAESNPDEMEIIVSVIMNLLVH